jgi:hypothetical protein
MQMFRNVAFGFLCISILFAGGCATLSKYPLDRHKNNIYQFTKVGIYVVLKEKQDEFPLTKVEQLESRILSIQRTIQNSEKCLEDLKFLLTKDNIPVLLTLYDIIDRFVKSREVQDTKGLVLAGLHGGLDGINWYKQLLRFSQKE